jgi:hypothetical protein
MGTRAWGIVLAIIVIMVSCKLAGAADWSVVPSITQRSEFNSNLNLSPTNILSDYIFSLRPEVEFNYTTEISQLQGRLGLFGQHYITHDNIDHIDQNYQINGRYQATPRINLSLYTSYIEDTTLIEELLTSGVVIGRTPRRAFYVAPGISYNLTERLMATASYNFNRVLYQSPDFDNYTSHQAGLTFTYLLKNEKTSLISNNVVNYSLYSNENNYKSIGIYGGIAHKITERWDVTVMAGANINFYSFNTQVLDSSVFPFFIRVPTEQLNESSISPNKMSGISPYVNLSTSYHWTKLTVDGGFGISQQPSAYGAIYQVKRLYGSLSYNFTERLSGYLSAGYSLSTQSSQDIDSEWNYYSISPALNYRITERLSVSPGYSFFNSASLTDTGSSAHTHIAWVQFSYAYPFHYQR